ncbi:MAG: hypothetical protein WCX73_01245 [Candidatus Pacearchaeota archaeon]|jgi:hypothetical protein
MGFKKRFAILILLLLIIMPMALALDTPIKVKTKPGYIVTIRVLDIDGKGTLENGQFLDQMADQNGIINITYSSDVINKIDISIMVRAIVGGAPIQFTGGPVQLFNNNGEHIKTGWPVEIDSSVNPPQLVKSGKQEGIEEAMINNSTTEEIINESNTSSSTEEGIEVSVVVEDTQEINSSETNAEVTGITGKAINIGGSIFTSKITYSILGILIIGTLVFFIFRSKMNTLQSTKLNGEPEVKDQVFRVLPRDNTKIDEAERKLEEAKRELDEIRKRNGSLEEARKRLEADKQEIERLERGEF